VVLGGHACTAGGPYKCLAAITLAALWLRLQSPSVTSDLLQDAVQRAVCLPAAQLITQPSDGMAELLSSDE